MNKRINDN